jgi:hypothetical protein
MTPSNAASNTTNLDISVNVIRTNEQLVTITKTYPYEKALAEKLAIQKAYDSASPASQQAYDECIKDTDIDGTENCENEHLGDIFND